MSDTQRFIRLGQLQDAVEAYQTTSFLRQGLLAPILGAPTHYAFYSPTIRALHTLIDRCMSDIHLVGESLISEAEIQQAVLLSKDKKKVSRQKALTEGMPTSSCATDLVLNMIHTLFQSAPEEDDEDEEDEFEVIKKPDEAQYFTGHHDDEYECEYSCVHAHDTKGYIQVFATGKAQDEARGIAERQAEERAKLESSRKAEVVKRRARASERERRREAKLPQAKTITLSQLKAILEAYQTTSRFCLMLGVNPLQSGAMRALKQLENFRSQHHLNVSRSEEEQALYDNSTLIEERQIVNTLNDKSNLGYTEYASTRMTRLRLFRTGKGKAKDSTCSTDDVIRRLHTAFNS